MDGIYERYVRRQVKTMEKKQTKLDVGIAPISPTIGRVRRMDIHPELANYFKLYALQKKAEKTRKYYTDNIGNQTRINYAQHTTIPALVKFMMYVEKELDVSYDFL